MVILTSEAIKAIRDISSLEDIGHVNIRVKLLGGGCAGFTHDMYFEDNIKDTDEVIEIEDIKLIIDPLSYQYLEGITIDYVTKNLAGGFKFISPKIDSVCGCGNSYSFKKE